MRVKLITAYVDVEGQDGTPIHPDLLRQLTETVQDDLLNLPLRMRECYPELSLNWGVGTHQET